jgi:hypothetical protein
MVKGNDTYDTFLGDKNLLLRVERKLLPFPGIVFLFSKKLN